MFNKDRDDRIKVLESAVRSLETALLVRESDYERLNSNYNDLTLRLCAIEHPNPYTCGDRVVYRDDVCTVVGSEQLPFTDWHPYNVPANERSHWSYTLISSAGCLVNTPQFTALIMDKDLTPYVELDEVAEPKKKKKKLLKG